MKIWRAVRMDSEAAATATILASITGLVVIAIFSVLKIQAYQHEANWIVHSRHVLGNADETLVLVKNLHISFLEYLAERGNTSLADIEDTHQASIRHAEELKHLTADNPLQRENSRVLGDQLRQLSLANEAATALGLMRDGGLGAVTPAVDRVERLVTPLAERVILIKEEEQGLLTLRRANANASVHTTLVSIMLGTLVACAMLLTVFQMLRREVLRHRKTDSELVQANNVLQEQASQLQAANAELESFSYSISHDLRIPVRAVAGYARMLEEDHMSSLPPEGQRLLGVIGDNGRRMGILIDDLLAFARLGRQTIHPVRIDMNDMVDAILVDLENKFGWSPSQVSVEAGLPVLTGDRALMHQVMLNLLANAFKYSSGRETAPLIQVKGWVQDAEAVYAISDNGVGFDMQYIDKLFGVFQRLHHTREFPGTGVGLALVKRIVTAHGGRVWAEGLVGAGAEFGFAIPQGTRA